MNKKKRYSIYQNSCKNQCKNYRNDLEWLGNQMQEIPSFEITVGVDGINWKIKFAFENFDIAWLLVGL